MYFFNPKYLIIVSYFEKQSSYYFGGDRLVFITQEINRYTHYAQYYYEFIAFWINNAMYKTFCLFKLKFVRVISHLLNYLMQFFNYF